MIETPLRNGRGADVDALLRDYFRAEMPRPWPRLHAPRAVVPAPSIWRRVRMHLGVAAAVLLLLGGYVTLSARFPTEPTASTLEGRVIGKGLRPVRIVPAPVERVKTRQGSDARVVEETTPDGAILINVQKDMSRGRR